MLAESESTQPSEASRACYAVLLSMRAHPSGEEPLSLELRGFVRGMNGDGQIAVGQRDLMGDAV